MKCKILIILSSLAIALFVMSNGYSFWQKNLTIKGNITVIQPKKPEQKLQIPLNQLPIITSPTLLNPPTPLDPQPHQVDSINLNSDAISKTEDNVEKNKESEDVKKEKEDTEGENKGNNGDISNTTGPESSNGTEENYQESFVDSINNGSAAPGENIVKVIENSTDNIDLNKN